MVTIVSSGLLGTLLSWLQQSLPPTGSLRALAATIGCISIPALHSASYLHLLPFR